ncbi:hypothetical protein ACOMHN_012906 [Nucella lapillus]
MRRFLSAWARMDKYPCQATLLQQQQMQQQQFAERILEHLAFNSDILERWHQIGSTQGLNTDLEVATFLIQHYESTWDRAQPSDFCLTCHTPLTLSCPKCTAVANGNAPNPNPHDHPDALSPPLFNPGDNGATYNAADLQAAKGKKHKKGRRQDGEIGGGVDNDDDLLGLYIQFGQSPPPPGADNVTPGQGAMPPFPQGKPLRKKAADGKSAQKKSNGHDGAKVKSFVCTHCGKVIYKYSDFKKHVRIHTREKPYKCEYCASAFSDASSAARHRRIHTGEKPFKCDVCPAAFAQSSDLTKHMRVHTQERPWQCQQCQKTFSDSSRFAHHRRQHEKEAAAGGGTAGKIMAKADGLGSHDMDLVGS